MTNRFRDEVKKSTGSGNAIMTLSMFELRPRGRLQFVGETRSSRSKAGRIGGPPSTERATLESWDDKGAFSLLPSTFLSVRWWRGWRGVRAQKNFNGIPLEIHRRCPTCIAPYKQRISRLKTTRRLFLLVSFREKEEKKNLSMVSEQRIQCCSALFRGDKPRVEIGFRARYLAKIYARRVIFQGIVWTGSYPLLLYPRRGGKVAICGT